MSAVPLTALSTLLLALAPSVPAPAAAAPASAASRACATAWGSLAKTAPGVPGTADPFRSRVPGVRTGHHACFDRVVFDVEGPIGAPTAEDVDSYRAYAGSPITGTFIQVAIPQEARMYVDAVTSVRGTGLTTVTGTGLVGKDPNRSTFVVQTRARLPYRLFVLKGPGATNRVVIDVAHRW